MEQEKRPEMWQRCGLEDPAVFAATAGVPSEPRVASAPIDERMHAGKVLVFDHSVLRRREGA